MTSADGAQPNAQAIVSHGEAYLSARKVTFVPAGGTP